MINKPKTIENLTTPSFQKQHSFLMSQVINERKGPSATILQSSSSKNLVFDALDLVNMFETVDESIFDAVAL